MTIQHTVREGDCIDSIAYRHGFLPSTLWDLPDNSELKELRKDGNVLQPGDLVVVPDLEEKMESCADQKRHSFRRRGVPAVLRMVFSRLVEPEEEEGTQASRPYDPSAFEDSPQQEPEPEFEPIRNAPYVLNLDGEISEGKSDGDGFVQIPILPDAKSGKITFHHGTEDEISYDIDLGFIDSVEIPIGQRKRLLNLGYRCDAEGDEPDETLRQALKQFQKDNDLEQTGEADQTTQQQLMEIHGS